MFESRQRRDHCLGTLLSPLLGRPPNGVGIAGHALVYSRREVGFGRTPRQPGQVRKEAAVTSFGSGRCSTFHLKGAA